MKQAALSPAQTALCIALLAVLTGTSRGASPRCCQGEIPRPALELTGDTLGRASKSSGTGDISREELVEGLYQDYFPGRSYELVLTLISTRLLWRPRWLVRP